MRTNKLIAMIALGTPLACGSALLGGKSTSHHQKAPPSQEPLVLHGELEHYQNCDELRQALINNSADFFETQRLEHLYWQSRYSQSGGSAKASSASMPDMAPSAATSGAEKSVDSSTPPAASNKDVTTNLQEAGVDEADQIKMGAQHIFVVNNQLIGGVQIAVTRKSPMKYLGILALNDMQSAMLYATENRLLVAGRGQKAATDNQGVAMGFWVKAYDTSGADMPSLISEKFFRGTYVDSRFVQGRLVMVFQDRIPLVFQNNNWDYQDADSREEIVLDLEKSPVVAIQDDKAADVGCSSFTKSPFDNGQPDFTRVVAFDVTAGQLVSEVAVPGTPTRQMYMSEDQVVLAGHPAAKAVWVNYEDQIAWTRYQAFNKELNQRLEVIEINYDAAAGLLSAAAKGEVAGALKPFGAQWAFKALRAGERHLLALFTTTGSVRVEDDLGAADNHLWVLEADGLDLKTVASVPSLGAGEDIRAVRYSGNFAYVVTFERTDPLFAIDLSDPLTPQIAGELKMPGFSMYLHPTAEGRLIGVGYDTEEKQVGDGAFFQGLQLSLFDASKPENLVRLDNKIMGKRGSYTEVTQDHHAFYYDPTDAVLALPLVTFNDDVGIDAQAQDQTLNQNRMHNTLDFSGAIFFKESASGFEEIKRISHFSSVPALCQANFLPVSWQVQIPPQADVRRIFRSGDTIFTVSNYSVRSWNAADFHETGSAEIPFADCLPRRSNGGFE